MPGQAKIFKISVFNPPGSAFLLPHAMSDKLAEIIATKRLEVEALMPRAELLRAAALQRNDFGGFRTALDRGPGRLGVIAEVKKASPSVGLIDPDFDPVRQAKRYLEGGASCLSILTDEKYFQGSLSYLTQISKFSEAPLLRKDFTIHEVQIHEAAVAGADAILLIVAALDDATLRRLYDEAKALHARRAGGSARPPGNGARAGTRRGFDRREQPQPQNLRRSISPPPSDSPRKCRMMCC